MKIGVVGKGGTGKTTISALLAQAYAEQGKQVVAIDTDSNPNLAMSLGLEEQTAAEAPLVPRRLVLGGGDASPEALLADYGVATPAGVTLLHAMRVDQAGAGCMCAGHASVRSLLEAALGEHTDVAVVDMEAGLEHLSRSGGTLAHVDVMLIVTEPTRKSLLTAARTVALAHELGVIRVAGVGNKARPDDAESLERMAAEYGVRLAAVVPHDDEVIDADRMGSRLRATGLTGPVRQLVEFIDSDEELRTALHEEKARLDQQLAALRNG